MGDRALSRRTDLGQSWLTAPDAPGSRSRGSRVPTVMPMRCVDLLAESRVVGGCRRRSARVEAGGSRQGKGPSVLGWSPFFSTHHAKASENRRSQPTHDEARVSGSGGRQIWGRPTRARTGSQLTRDVVPAIFVRCGSQVSPIKWFPVSVVGSQPASASACRPSQLQ